MLIEDPEGFKIWLTSKLEPLCDADPAALAKYVYALVKKDKPIEDLKVSMLDQLEVFLQKETKGFVELLFNTLETGDFEVEQVGPNDPAQVTSTKALVSDVDLRDNILSVPLQSQTSDLDQVKKEPHKESISAIVSSAQNSNSFGSVLLAAASGRKDALDRPSRKSESDKEERGVRARGRRRGSSISPDRRRSRSYDRRRSRSRERDRSRAWRNKSPPLRRYERRRSYSKSPVRRHSRSRSPPPSKRGRYRNRSPPRSHSRSITPNRQSADGDLKSMITSPSRDNQRDTDLRLPQNLTSVVNVADGVKPYPTKRCRDFDEKGFCMRGDMCLYDHGSDPVVLEDIPTAVMYNGATAGTNSSLHASQLLHNQESPPNSLEYNPSAPNLEPRAWRRYFRPGQLMRGPIRGGGVTGTRGIAPTGNTGVFNHKRELISVVTGTSEPQTQLSQLSAPYRNTRSHDNHMRENNNKRFDPYSRSLANRRITSSGPPPNVLPTSHNTLQLKKVPTQMNNITDLNNHFAKFGKIVNILVGFEGDPEAALITFSNHLEANSAYKSAEAVLNNRFIKVFWYNPSNNNNNSLESKQENIPPTPRPTILERLGAPPMQKVLHSLQPSTILQQQERVTLSNNNISKTIYVPSIIKKDSPEKPTEEEILKKKIDEEALKEIKKKQEAKKERLKMNAELRKRKQVLLEKQLSQQKLLIQLIDSGSVKIEQKDTIMSTIKSLQESIETLKKDLTEDVEASLSNVGPKKPNPKESLALFKKTTEETQRELLDAELDLLKQEQQGKEVVELKKKISDLKLKAFQMKMPIFKATPYSRGRGSFRARGTGVAGRGAGRGGVNRFSYNPLDYNVVDHRPTKLLVSGYEEDDKAEVLAHFNQYGEIINYTSDDATPSLVLNFKSRKEAEVALAKGKNFQDRLLSVTWATPNHNIRPGITTQNTPVIREEDMCEDILESAEDEDEIVETLSPADSLLLQDEEDDDDEERSWRR